MAQKLRAHPDRVENAINPHVDRIIAHEMDLGVGPLKAHLVEEAEAYHSRYQAQKEKRLSDLREMLEQLGHPEDVIVMLYCKNFVPLFKNWLASCDKHKISVRQRLITFTLDKDSADQTAALGIKTYFLDPEIYMPAGGAAQFGDKKFARTMYYKNACIMDILSLGANVLFQDADLVWFRDPFEYLRERRGDSDLQIMFDGRNPMHGPLYANTGFIYATCNDASKALFDTAIRNTASVFQRRSHQAPLNRIMAHFALHNVLAVKVLPEGLFLNGHLFLLKRGVNERVKDWRTSGYVVHYSWTGTLEEKRQKMEKFGFNFLPMSQNLELPVAGPGSADDSENASSR